LGKKNFQLLVVQDQSFSNKSIRIKQFFHVQQFFRVQQGFTTLPVLNLDTDTPSKVPVTDLD